MQALGNLYFVDESLAGAESPEAGHSNGCRIWNFLTHDWEPVAGKSVHTGNIEAVATKEKAKFPQHFFPECKWSRKGFLRTRWSLAGTVLDLVNIHLFHDASNLAASEQYPSVYCASRRRALVHTMERLHTDRANGVAPYFVFGDFNFRCDTAGVVQRLAERLTAHRLPAAEAAAGKRSESAVRVQYCDAAGEAVLTIGKKEFVHREHQAVFKEDWVSWGGCVLLLYSGLVHILYSHYVYVSYHILSNILLLFSIYLYLDQRFLLTSFAIDLQRNNCRTFLEKLGF